MKKLFGIVIFFLLAFPVFAEEPGVFLSNQNSVQTTQFESTDEIYIGGICLPAGQDIARIYIIPDKTWQAGDKLFDVSVGIETFAGSASGGIPRTKIWNRPLQGTYDIVIDTNNDLILQEYEKQCIVGVTGAGFRVGNPAPIPPPAETTPPSPPPASTPPSPPPPASIKPSIVFSLDENVETKNLANVRKSAGGTLIGSQEKGALGVVIGGPVKEFLDGNNYWFWNINFEDGPDGWVAASMLKSAPAPAEEIVAEKNIESSEDAATTTIEEMSQEEIAAEKTLAQVSGVDGGSGLDPFIGSIIIGAALFLGLVSGSFIIARTLRKN